MTVPPRVYRVQALVLHRHNLGETDRIARLFTREYGKVGAVAKGARGPRSRLSGATEPFTRLSGQLARGQNLDILTQAVVEDAYPALRRDLTRVGFAAHCLEIADAGLEERQPSPEFWDLTVSTLKLLETAVSPDLLARAFEWRALSVLGYEPFLEACVEDGAGVLGPGAQFHPQRGGLLCPRCAHTIRGGVRLLPQSVQALRELPGVRLSDAARASLPDAVRREVAACLAGSLRQHLGTELRGLQFLEGVSEL
ncbi:MAG: DNA repair protein RecO [Armatimonadetes bacterium]|nr:DNA repair protein RecO [Armatimonadota bacterium]